MGLMSAAEVVSTQAAKKMVDVSNGAVAKGQILVIKGVRGKKPVQIQGCQRQAFNYCQWEVKDPENIRAVPNKPLNTDSGNTAAIAQVLSPGEGTRGFNVRLAQAKAWRPEKSASALTSARRQTKWWALNSAVNGSAKLLQISCNRQK